MEDKNKFKNKTIDLFNTTKSGITNSFDTTKLWTINSFNTTKSWFKADIARWNIVFLVLFTIILVLANVLLQAVGLSENYDPALVGSGFVWPIWLSLFSAFFGMLNVCTYSLMKINDPAKRNRYKIFIIFNSLAVISLAIVNFKFKLYILLLENVLFFFSGCLQYYMWFIKDQDKVAEQRFIFRKFTNEDLYWFVIGVVMILFLIFTRLFFMSEAGKLSGATHLNSKGIPVQNHIPYYYTRAIVDPCLGIGGMLGAFMVAKRKYFSVYIYWVNDILLVLMWVVLLVVSLIPSTNKLANDEAVTLLTSVNMIALFTFYFLTNLFNFFKWKPNLEHVAGSEELKDEYEARMKKEAKSSNSFKNQPVGAQLFSSKDDLKKGSPASLKKQTVKQTNTLS